MYRLLTVPGFVENFEHLPFAAGARIAVKFEQNVAVGDFYSKMNYKYTLTKMGFWGIFETHMD